MDDAYPERAGQWIVAQACKLFEIGALFENFLRLVDQRVPDLGDANLGATSFKNSDAEFLFKLAYGHRKRGLTDKTGLGGTPKMTFARDSNNVFEFSQGHDVSDE